MNWPEVLQVTAFCLAALFAAVVVTGAGLVVSLMIFRKFMGDKP